jgi:hypothetical protein
MKVKVLVRQNKNCYNRWDAENAIGEDSKEVQAAPTSAQHCAPSCTPPCGSPVWMCLVQVDTCCVTGTTRRCPMQDVLALAVVKNVYVSCSVRDHFVEPSQAAFFRPTEIR